MPERAERRQAGRLFVPRHFTDAELDIRESTLLDLSPAGARIEHANPYIPGSSAPSTSPVPSAVSGCRVE